MNEPMSIGSLTSLNIRTCRSPRSLRLLARPRHTHRTVHNIFKPAYLRV